MEPLPVLDAEVYAHLRALAGRVAAGQSSGLQPTELLHEAWMKLVRTSTPFKDRGHFMSVAAQAMRQILVDQARARLAQKRGAGAQRTTVSGLADEGPGMDLLDLDEALSKLAEIDAAASEVAIMRIFGGCTVDEVAVATDTSVRTVARKWRFGRAFIEQAIAKVM